MDDFSNRLYALDTGAEAFQGTDAPRIRRLLGLPQKLTDHCEEVPEWDRLLEGPVCA